MKMGDIIRDERQKADMTQEQLAEYLGLKKSAVAKYENGRVKNIKRSIIAKMAELFHCEPSYLMGFSETFEAVEAKVRDKSKRFIEIDVLGSVPAGVPTEAMEDIVGQVEIPEEWTADGSEFRALRVKGDSMYPLYLEGDIVILRIQPDCHNGQDAVVYVNGYDATIKKVIKNADGTTTLKAINPEWKSKTYGPHDEPIRIWGVVVKLERSYK